MIFGMPRSLGEYFESKCIAFVKEGKGKRLPDEIIRCVHDGSKGDSDNYSRVYLLNVKRTNPLEPNRAKARFFYHTITVTDKEGTRQVERCELKASEEAIRLIGDTFEVGGYLRKLSMHFMDKEGNIDFVRLKSVLEMALKMVDNTDNPEIKIILDK
jgi:hypothetical protein